MARIPVSLTVSPYYHCQPLVTGEVTVDGAELILFQPSPEKTMQRFAHHRHVDVSEFSLAQYVALRSRGDTSLIALPVFPSRVFRHSALYVKDPNLQRADDLNGRRVGVPEWAQTAGVWIRGILADDYGVDLPSVNWVQGGVNNPGRRESARSGVPAGWSLERRTDVSLDDLLARGEIDAVISARAPASFGAKASLTRRLFADYRAEELRYWQRSGICPPMHILVMRTELHDRHPFLALSLLDAFEQAKALAEQRLTDQTLSLVAVPWLAETVAELRPNFAGHGWWPYGVEANRRALETFLRYSLEQGVAGKPLTVDELFAPSCLDPEVHV